MVTAPRWPSMISRSPVEMRVTAPLTPTTAGISRARAMIEVWLVRVPTSVTKPETGSSTMAAVSAGERSRATMMSWPSSLGTRSWVRPPSARRRRSPMNSTSWLRSRR